MTRVALNGSRSHRLRLYREQWGQAVHSCTCTRRTVRAFRKRQGECLLDFQVINPIDRHPAHTGTCTTQVDQLTGPELIAKPTELHLLPYTRLHDKTDWQLHADAYARSLKEDSSHHTGFYGMPYQQELERFNFTLRHLRLVAEPLNGFLSNWSVLPTG